MNMMVSALKGEGADEVTARRAAEGIATSDQGFKKPFSELREDNQKMRVEMANFAGALRTEMASFRGELRTEMQGVRGALTLIKWIGGVLIALGIATVLRLYLG